MQTLQLIYVNIQVEDIDASLDPLFGIPSELEKMRTISNNIESFNFGVIIPADVKCRRGDDWGKLDEVLTKPGWTSLWHVSLSIEIETYKQTEENDEQEAALRALPETQFRRLSSSHSVSFNFQVTLLCKGACSSLHI